MVLVRDTRVAALELSKMRSAQKQSAQLSTVLSLPAESSSARVRTLQGRRALRRRRTLHVLMRPLIFSDEDVRRERVTKWFRPKKGRM